MKQITCLLTSIETISLSIMALFMFVSSKLQYLFTNHDKIILTNFFFICWSRVLRGGANLAIKVSLLLGSNLSVTCFNLFVSCVRRTNVMLSHVTLQTYWIWWSLVTCRFVFPFIINQKKNIIIITYLLLNNTFMSGWSWYDPIWIFLVKQYVFKLLTDFPVVFKSLIEQETDFARCQWLKRPVQM